MSILTIIAVLVCVGILVLIISKVPFIDARYKKIIYWVIFALVVIWLLKVFGVFGYVSQIKV